MLQESQDLFDIIKKTAQQAEIKRAKRKIFITKYKKRLTILGIAFIITSSLFFPKQTGYVIGKWINDFFGTIVKESNK